MFTQSRPAIKSTDTRVLLSEFEEFENLICKGRLPVTNTFALNHRPYRLSSGGHALGTATYLLVGSAYLGRRFPPTESVGVSAVFPPLDA
jgi:hypothetical protein